MRKADEKVSTEEQKPSLIGAVSGCTSFHKTEWKKPLIDRLKYELRTYTELAKRMDKLMHECNIGADYSGAKEAEIKRNCYNRFVNDLTQLVR